MPTPPAGDIACAQSPMQSRPSRAQRRSRLICTVSSRIFDQSSSSAILSCRNGPSSTMSPCNAGRPRSLISSKPRSGAAGLPRLRLRCGYPRCNDQPSDALWNDETGLQVIAAINQEQQLPVPGKSKRLSRIAGAFRQAHQRTSIGAPKSRRSNSPRVRDRMPAIGCR